jgi:hypothetical protein
MVSRLIRWLFKRNSLSTYIYRTEQLLAEKKYCEADACAFLGLQLFPNQPELLQLKRNAEKMFSSYLYSQELGHEQF